MDAVSNPYLLAVEAIKRCLNAVDDVEETLIEHGINWRVGSAELIKCLAAIQDTTIEAVVMELYPDE